MPDCTRIFGKNQEANYTHPLHNAACMRTPVTRWELHMTIGYRVSFLILLRTSKIKHDPLTYCTSIFTESQNMTILPCFTLI